MKHGFNEHSVITNNFLGEIGHFSTQLNPALTNQNKRFRAIRYNRVSLFLKLIMHPNFNTNTFQKHT
jgi:hypothetical protein